MNKRNTLTIVLITVVLLACSSTNTIKMSSSTMVNELVRDYYKCNKRYIMDYSVFHIQTEKINTQSIEAYTIIPENDEIAFKVYLEDSINNKNLPTHYLEYKEKLFLWREGSYKISDSVMQYIYNRKLVDSSYVKYQMGLIQEEDIQQIFITIDEELKGVTYVFCKSNPLKIKRRIKSNRKIQPDDIRLQVKCD